MFRTAVSVLLLVFCTNILCEEDVALNEVVELDSSNFDSFSTTHHSRVVMFYAPFCGHCKNFKPDFEKVCIDVHTALKGVLCGRVDCTKNEDICSKHHVQGYPTITKLSNHGSCNYQGKRTHDDLFKWVKSGEQLNTVAPDTASVKTFLGEHQTSLIGYFPDLSHKFKKVVDGCHCLATPMDYLTVSDSKVAADLGLDHENSLYVFKKGEKVKVVAEIESSEELSKNLFFELNPLVPEFTQDTYVSIFGPGISFYLVFAHDSSTKNLEKYAGLLEVFAKRVSGKVRVFTIDVSLSENADPVKYFSIKDTPQVLFYDDSIQKYYHFDGVQTEVTEDSLQDFVDGCINGTRKPYVKRQPVPKDWDSNPVKVLVTDNFYQPLDSGKKQIVMFYAPWCGHCQQLKPIWDEIGELVEKKHKDVIVAKFDHTENDIEDIDIAGYPTIIAFLSRTEKVVYEGKRTLEDISDFIDGGFKPEKKIDDEHKEEDTHEDL